MWRIRIFSNIEIQSIWTFIKFSDFSFFRVSRNSKIYFLGCSKFSKIFFRFSKNFKIYFLGWSNISKIFFRVSKNSKILFEAAQTTPKKLDFWISEFLDLRFPGKRGFSVGLMSLITVRKIVSILRVYRWKSMCLTAQN